MYTLCSMPKPGDPGLHILHLKQLQRVLRTYQAYRWHITRSPTLNLHKHRLHHGRQVLLGRDELRLALQVLALLVLVVPMYRHECLDG